MAVQLIAERTRLASDPVRNFKFQCDISHPDASIDAAIGMMGFTSVGGISMSTEMVPYREGGWNTNPHKLPGMTDFSPLSMQAGVFYTKPGMWNLAKQMFAVQWGNGSIGMGEEFRFDMIIRILDHPVTRGSASGSGGGPQGSPDGTILAYQVWNAWVASVAFGDLNAMDNQVLIHNMTVHHEGFDVFWGNQDALGLTHTG